MKYPGLGCARSGNYAIYKEGLDPDPNVEDLTVSWLLSLLFYHSHNFRICLECFHRYQPCNFVDFHSKLLSQKLECPPVSSSHRHGYKITSNCLGGDRGWAVLGKGVAPGPGPRQWECHQDEPMPVPDPPSLPGTSPPAVTSTGFIQGQLNFKDIIDYETFYIYSLHKQYVDIR